jgi:6-phosphogluconate dehydrogenase
MENEKCKLGMIGLGTMGRNLLLNMADHGFKVCGYDRDTKMVDNTNREGESTGTKGFNNIQDFINNLQSPRVIMLLVPAGKIVDTVIDELIPLLSKGDIIIDGGNSYVADTERRVVELSKKHLHFFGMGISGGEEGARRGPSMMPGGDKVAYEVVRPILEAIAAKVNNEPCVTYIGPGASGHFVKMVHNGIEYALMQLISEAYSIMKNGLEMPNSEIQKVFADWNKGRLKSYLLEITQEIFLFEEKGAAHLLLDDIKDEAKSKGTGKWTSQIAMDLEVPITVIDTAVAIRNLSKLKGLRLKAEKIYKDKQTINANKQEFLIALEQTMYFATVVTYAQGLHMLFKASADYGYGLKLDEIAKIWRGGCIIRAEFLEDIYQAYHHDKDLEHLLLDAKISVGIKETLQPTRKVLSQILPSGIGVPALTSALSYFETLITGRMPSNLIQAQRDFFGAHTYEKISEEGIFHTDWESNNTTVAKPKK